MPAKKPKTGDDAINLMSPIFTDEDTAREFIESKRWANGRCCPRCGCESTYALTPKPDSKRPVRPGVYKCKECRKQFTVRIGTIFEDSRLPLHKWLAAIFLMCSSKKGISSHQLSRDLDITVKTAWFLSHRIREAMKQEPMTSLLSGAVEVDETYVGGKPRHKGTSKRGRGTQKKPVVALVERDGRVAAKPVDRVDSKTLHGEVLANVSEESIILTDDFRSYEGIGKHFAGGHETVNHSAKEYGRVHPESGLPINTNTAESYFSLVKRQHYGIHHHYSKKHMSRYIDEAAFRWNTRKNSDGVRMALAVQACEGKRMTYN